jgi:sugar lactone lactonase YvrE
MWKAIRILTAVAGVIVVPIGVAGAAEGEIWLVAGGGGNGHGGDGGLATTAQLAGTTDCELAPDGVVYVAEEDRVRRIGTDGVITTLIGSREAGERPMWPSALAVDANGVLYIGDSYVPADFSSPGGPRVLSVTPSGVAEHIAGQGHGLGYSGDGGPAGQAEIGQPLSLTLTGDALYFTDPQREIVRRVDLQTRIISTVPELAGAYEIAAGPSGEIYASSLTSHSIWVLETNGEVRPIAGIGTAGYSGDGGPATAAALNTPLALAVDAAGTLFVSDAGNHRIRRVGTDGTITTVVGTGEQGYSGDGGPALVATITFPSGLGVDLLGGLCIADGVVRYVDSAALNPPPTNHQSLPETGGRVAAVGLASVLTAVGAVLLRASGRRRRSIGRPLD